MPSLSMSRIFNFSPYYSPSRVSPHSHRPFVHGLIVGPTPNPQFLRLIMTLLSRNDFPVLYLPATEITPTRSFIWLRNSFASSDTLNCSLSWVLIYWLLTWFLIVIYQMNGLWQWAWRLLLLLKPRRSLTVIFQIWSLMHTREIKLLDGGRATLWKCLLIGIEALVLRSSISARHWVIQWGAAVVTKVPNWLLIWKS